MARYIDAEPLPHGQFWDNCTDTEKAKILSWILSQPTVDVVKVVRCSDCKYYDEEDGYCWENNKYVMQIDYCSFSEEKEVEE